MKKTYVWLAICSIVSVMALAACASPSDSDGTPMSTEPAMDLTLTPEAGMTEEPLETMEPTEIPEVTESVTEVPAIPETAQATEPVTATEVIPSTGLANPALVSNQLDYDVWNLNDEQIGTAEDMLINLETQQVDYLIVEVGGFLGIGGKLVAVPYERLQLDTSSSTSESEPQNVWILDVSQEELEGAPAFDRDALPPFGDPALDYDVDFRSHWVTVSVDSTATVETPVAVSTPMPGSDTALELQGVVLASNVLEMNFVDNTGGDLAEIVDLVVDPETGEIRYLVVEINETIIDLSGKWVLIPLDAIRIDTTNQVFSLSIDNTGLSGVPFYEPNEIPDTSIEDWDNDLIEFWDSLF